ncbi:MAG TPA: PadR family transcriptional regulator [Nitrospiria bacterium]|jgi:DNA-binding PadR family transcriptional regulator|nr:PadR family transcriptional regulator [Nitrospiria bacterium]
MFGFGHFKGGRRGWLRPWILSIVSRSPKNGAEIMDEIEKMSWGGWRPSPGSIYPLLEEMTKDGLIQKKDDGRYEITEGGKGETDWPFGMPFGNRPHGVDQMLSEINGYIMYFEDLSRTDRSKITQYQSSIRDLAARLSKLGE